MINKIEKKYGSNILIGYGAGWGTTSQIKHYMPTMNIGLRRLIQKKVLIS
jgi:hypothetical protein